MYVKEVKNLTYKSFKNYTGPTEGGGFSQFKNIIYGPNGKGKSALAKGIEDQYISDNAPMSEEEKKEKIRHFNCDYIENNLMFSPNDDKKIKGVVIKLGSENVHLQQHIDEVKEEIINLKSQMSEQNAQLSSVRCEIINICRDIYDKYKSRSLKNHINDIKDNQDISALLEAYKNDLDSALKIAGGYSMESYLNKDGIEDEINKIKNVSIDTISHIGDEELVKTITILKDCNYDTTAAPDPSVVEWIVEGTKIHQNGDKCKFCGGDVDLNEIQARINIFKNTRKQMDAEFLIKLSGRLREVLQSAQKTSNNKIIIQEMFKEVPNQVFDELKQEIEMLSEFVEDVEKKMNDMNKQYSFDINQIKSSLENMENITNKIISERDKLIKKLQQTSDKDSVMRKGIIAQEILNNQEIIIKHNKEKELLNKIDDIQKSIDADSSDIKKSEEKFTNITKFADIINSMLSYRSIDLKLEPNDGNYVIKHSIENDLELSINDISEGEKNLISLIYFYCELFEDENLKKFKSTIELVIIDDPISSLDNQNEVFISTLIDEICKASTAQIFVFTHSWNEFSVLYSFYCDTLVNVETNSENEPSSRDSEVQKINKYLFWQVNKDKGISQIKLTTPGTKLLTPYRYAFLLIYDAVKEGTTQGELTEEQIRGLPNSMRCVLEDYLKFRFYIFSINLSNLNRITAALCSGKLTPANITEVKNLISVCNGGSHELIHNEDEIYNAAKFLMNRIKEIDPQHFNSMTSQLERGVVL